MTLYVFCCLARLSTAKGSRRYWKRYAAFHQMFLIAVSFSSSGGPMTRNLLREVRAAAETSPHIRFRETVAHNEALALIQETDVMLCASSDETGPLTLIEQWDWAKLFLAPR